MEKENWMNKNIIITLTAVAAMVCGVVGVALTMIPAQGVDKITICHAAGLDGTTKFVTLNLPAQAVYGQAGHFNENGTPNAGHEDDYLGACVTDPTDEPTDPTTEPTDEPTDPTSEPTDDGTEEPTDTPTEPSEEPNCIFSPRLPCLTPDPPDFVQSCTSTRCTKEWEDEHGRHTETVEYDNVTEEGM